MMQVLYNREIFNNYKNCKTIPELFPLVECEVTLSSFLTSNFGNSIAASYYSILGFSDDGDFVVVCDNYTNNIIFYHLILSSKIPYIKISNEKFILKHENLYRSKVKVLTSNVRVNFIVSICKLDTNFIENEINSNNMGLPQPCYLRLFQLYNVIPIIEETVNIVSENHVMIESIVTNNDVLIILNSGTGFLVYYESRNTNCDHDDYESILSETLSKKKTTNTLKEFECSSYPNDKWFYLSTFEKKFRVTFDSTVFCKILIQHMYPNVQNNRFDIEDYEMRQVKFFPKTFDLICVIAVSLVHSKGVKSIFSLMNLSLLTGTTNVLLYGDLGKFCRINGIEFETFRSARMRNQINNWDYSQSFGVGFTESWLSLATDFYLHKFKIRKIDESNDNVGSMQLFQSTPFNSVDAVPLKRIKHSILPYTIVNDEHEDDDVEEEEN